MEWDKAARERLTEAPALLRAFVARKVEELAARRGQDRVTLEVWEEAKRLRGAAGTARQAEPQQGTPIGEELPPPEVLSALVRETETRGQRDGKTLRLRVCGGAFGCPRPQIDVAGLAGRLAEEVSRSGQAARLADVFGDRLLTHHKLALAVSGCINGCSEPQIKDFAVLGQARPDAVPGRCTGCRKCEAACKEGAVKAGGPGAASADPEFDRERCLNCGDCARACARAAIRLTPGYRILAGGRLGRHPRLAETLLAFTEDEETVLNTLRTVLKWAEETGEPGDRLGTLFDRFGTETLRSRLQRSYR
ncbi:MAG: 4Fe-4S dicluster domain-containing protein [Methanocella sp.]